jgi:hypothetical protein
MKRALLVLLLAPGLAFGAFDANGVKLADNELAVKKAFPGIRCKPLEWKSDAADRRCDDAKVAFAGVEARITFYLRGDSIQGFDVRFDTAQIDAVSTYLKGRYGKPLSEGREKIIRKGKEEREVFKILWEQGADKAMLSSLSTGKRASLSVSRGNFDDAIYRVK